MVPPAPSAGYARAGGPTARPHQCGTPASPTSAAPSARIFRPSWCAAAPRGVSGAPPLRTRRSPLPIFIHRGALPPRLPVDLAAALAELARHLFHAGLRLRSLRAVAQLL